MARGDLLTSSWRELHKAATAVTAFSSFIKFRNTALWTAALVALMITG